MSTRMIELPCRVTSSSSKSTGQKPTPARPSATTYKRASERPALSVARRNARERSRVHGVNQMFDVLRQRLPALRHRQKRVSKLKILRAAIDYICDLKHVLTAEDFGESRGEYVFSMHLK